MTAPALVLFDLDDTLCDYSSARSVRLHGAFARAIEQSGISGIDLERLVEESIAIHPHGSEHFPTLLCRYGVDEPDITRESRRWYHQNRFLGLELFADAHVVIDQIRSLDSVHAIGLITNGPADVQRDKITILDLWAMIDFAVISGELGIEKPDPRIFEEALRLGRTEADQAVYIGDSPEFDMDGALAAGIRRIWVNRPGDRWRRPTPPPEMQIRSLEELVSLIDH